MAPPLSEILRIARGAGEIIMGHYRTPDISVIRKEDDSPLTIADRESDEWIRRELSGLDPDIPILSEESALPPHLERKEWSRFWLVDPLDGTKEFLKKNGEFTVNIALIEEGEPVLGVILAPDKSLLYYAQKNEGAWKQVGEDEPRKISFRKAERSDPLTVVVSRSHLSPREEAFLETLSIRETLRVGSALKFGMLAEGAADVYPRHGPTMEWDVGAGDCIYRAAAEGEFVPPPFTYNKPDLRNGSFVLGLDQDEF